MTRVPAWRRYVTFWRRSVDQDLDAELTFHFDERVSDLMLRGRTAAEAREEAEIEFGDRDLYRARMREIDTRIDRDRDRHEWMHRLGEDIRLSLRSMRRAPGLTVMVVLTLALGIGANGAIFSMLDRIFLRPPPGVAFPKEIRRLYGLYDAPDPRPDFIRSRFNFPEVVDMQHAIGDSIRIAAFEQQAVRLGVTDDSPVAQVAEASAGYFEILGIRPWLGRFFAPEETQPASPQRVAVLSHRFWRSHFGSDSSVLGKTVPLGRQSYTVIGVAPPGFEGIDLNAIDLWRPMGSWSSGTSNPWYRQRNGASIEVVTRLKRNADERSFVRLANLGLHSASDAFAARTTVSTGPIIFAQGPDETSKESAIAVRLIGVTLIVLLIAIANVANLLLTRAIQRQREIAVRLALGISRRRLAAMLITESAMLAVLAGAAALFVATWGADLIRSLLLPNVNWGSPPLDLRLVASTMLVTLVAGALAGLLPFMRARRLDLTHAMRGGQRDGGYRSRARSALIMTQAALSVVLLAGAALFLRSLREIRSLDLGYDMAGTIAVTLQSGPRVIPPVEMVGGLRALKDRASSLPDVRAAALVGFTPMQGLMVDQLFLAGGDTLPTIPSGPPTYITVGPGFFDAAGIHLVAGREFTDADGAEAPQVAVINETMAHVVWPGRNAIGQCLHVASVKSPCTTVIGVTRDARRDKVIEEPMMQYYVPLSQSSEGRAFSTLLVRARADRVPAIKQELRAMIGQILPGARSKLETLAEQAEPQYRPWRIGAALFTAFGALALLVAAIGVYSAVAYAVTQRSHELGVRMALGAQRREISRLVIASGLRVVGAGVALGIVVSLALGRLIESLLYGTTAKDPAVLALVSAILLIVAIIASSLPAWRATRLDPVNALRAE